MGPKSFKHAGPAVLALAIVFGAVAVRADPLVIEGRATIVDNATLEIWGQRIRLAGIAVPAPRSKEGQAGKRFLEELLSGIRVRCAVAEPSLPSHASGRCAAAGVDISERLVQMGYARSVPR
jgi:endonuclease YncB( thermonuclease family)